MQSAVTEALEHITGTPGHHPLSPDNSSGARLLPNCCSLWRRTAAIVMLLLSAIKVSVTFD